VEQALKTNTQSAASSSGANSQYCDLTLLIIIKSHAVIS